MAARGEIDAHGAAACAGARVHLAHTDDFRMGALTIRPSRRTVRHDDGREEVVEPRVMQVLVALWRGGGSVIGRDDLVEACWEGRIVGDDAINRVISRLRRLADTIGAAIFRIETVTRVGYRLVTEQGVTASPAANPSAAAVAKAPRSIAVLPFANLTGDAAKDYLADGMAEELIGTLSRASNLKVPARTSTFSYKGRSLDVRSIARELGVSAVLEGSVRTAGERIRVTAQLIDADSGFHIWSQNYDRGVGDLFAVQDELAGDIARTLQAKLGAGSAHRVDPVAYELHLQARGLSARVMPDSLLRAIELHEQAIARDPGFARAWGGLAGTLMIATLFGVVPLDRRADARARAEQAIRLDPGYASPHAIIAALDTAAGRWLEADSGFRAAVALDPDEPVMTEAMAVHLLAPCGHLRRTFELAQKAARLAPASDNLHLSCALAANLCGDREARQLHFDTALLLGLSRQRGAVRILRSEMAREAGRLDEAAQRMAGAFQMSFPEAVGSADLVRQVYSALAGEGDRAAASRAVGAFVAAVDSDETLCRIPALPGYLILWQVLLGSLDGAFAIADTMVETWHRSGHLAASALPLFWRKDMLPFRRDPRFQPLVERLGLVPFWAIHGPPDGYRLDAGRLVEAAPSG